MLQARREPLTPRSIENLKASSVKTGAEEDVHLDGAGFECASKAPAASGDASQENHPQQQVLARSELEAKHPCENTRPVGSEELRTSIQMSEAESAAFSKRKADLTRLQADLEVREYQVRAANP